MAREGLPRLFEALERRWPQAKANRVDGLRLDWADRWVHVRPSNTEPILRVIAEAPRAEEAQKVVLPLAQSWFRWEKDPAAYARTREKLAAMTAECVYGAQRK